MRPSVLVIFGALLAAALAVSPPEQIHIALAGRDATGTSNGVSISWATPDATATSTVMYGLSPSALTMTATGWSVSYMPVRIVLCLNRLCFLAGPWPFTTALNLCVWCRHVPFRFPQPQTHHHVVITNLKIATRYYYKVGDSAGGFSGVLSFVSSPDATVPSFSVVRAHPACACGCHAGF